MERGSFEKPIYRFKMFGLKPFQMKIKTGKTGYIYTQDRVSKQKTILKPL